MRKNRSEVGKRISWVNKCILILAVLWLATLTALLFEAHQSRAHASQHARHAIVEIAAVAALPY